MKFKKFLLFLLLFIPCVARAATGDYEASIDKTFYRTLEEAYSAAKNGDTIVLRDNVELEDTLVVSKNITMDLNNFSISSNEKVISVDGAKLNLTGKGEIFEKSPNYYAVTLRGSTDRANTNYSYVSVGKDVTLTAWAPIFIDRLGTVEREVYNAAYGVNADIYGNLNAKTDPSGSHGLGIYINGTIKDKTNYPKITVHDGATINSTGSGIYMAGFGKIDVNKANITGVDSAASIKSGTLNFKGSNLTATGPKVEPQGSTGSINPTGAALQIESNKNYAGDISISIDNDKYISKNSNVIIEYLAPNTSETSVTSFVIKDGTFTSQAGLPVFNLSSSFKQKFDKFIQDGTFSSDVNEYLVAAFRETNNQAPHKSYGKIFLITILGALLIFVGYKYIKYRRNRI